MNPDRLSPANLFSLAGKTVLVTGAGCLKRASCSSRSG